MDGYEFQQLQMLREIRSELKMIRRTLDEMAKPQVGAHHIGRQITSKTLRKAIEKASHIEPKTSDP